MAKTKPLIYHADDEPIIRRIVGKTFDKMLPEFGVTFFSSGRELEEKFLQDIRDGTLPVGVIVDHIMHPGITGLDFIKKYSQYVPMIMASSSEIEKEALKHGAAAYIAKPFDVSSFVKTVKDVYKL